MSGQIIGGSVGQQKGSNFGILNTNEVADLVREDEYSNKPGMVYLGSHDYTSSTLNSGINIPTVANSGYLDPTNYRTHMILVSRIRQSHTNLMNIVFTFRNSGNTGAATGNYYSWAYETLQDSSDNNSLREQNAGSYMRSTDYELKNEDDAQAVQQIYLFDIGQNTKFVTVFSRTALRSYAYSGRHRSFDQTGTLGNRDDLGAFRWSGYTTSTWNAKFDIYGIMEK